MKIWLFLHNLVKTGGSFIFRALGLKARKSSFTYHNTLGNLPTFSIFSELL
jgi:hypothetical protein